MYKLTAYSNPITVSIRMWRPTVLLLLTLAACVAYPSTGGLDVEKLGAGGKKFFMDVSLATWRHRWHDHVIVASRRFGFQMTKQVMGVPSLKPENLAAQAFFRNFLDKYTKLDDKVRFVGAWILLAAQKASRQVLWNVNAPRKIVMATILCTFRREEMFW